MNNSFQQVACPWCGVMILSGEARFSKNDSDPKRVKINHSYCWACKKGVIFEVTDGTKDAVKASQPKYCLLIEDSGGCPQVHGTTDIYMTRGDANTYNCADPEITVRMGISIMGGVNFDSMRGACPFDPNYHDNYVEGKGNTIDEALIVMKKECEKISNGLLNC